MSKKKDIETIASFLGNAAAHVALLPESEFARKEAATYTTDTLEIIMERTWNEKELAEIKEKALRKAESEIRARLRKYGLGADAGKLGETAREYIEKFVESAAGSEKPA